MSYLVMMHTVIASNRETSAKMTTLPFKVKIKRIAFLGILGSIFVESRVSKKFNVSAILGAKCHTDLTETLKANSIRQFTQKTRREVYKTFATIQDKAVTESRS